MKDDAATTASRRTPGDEQQDSARQHRQREDHVDRPPGPTQQPESAAVPLPDADLQGQPIEHGRQPARPGQPGRWEAKPGERDEPGPVREPERRPTGQHEKA